MAVFLIVALKGKSTTKTAKSILPLAGGRAKQLAMAVAAPNKERVV